MHRDFDTKKRPLVISDIGYRKDHDFWYIYLNGNKKDSGNGVDPKNYVFMRSSNEEDYYEWLANR